MSQTNTASTRDQRQAAPPVSARSGVAANDDVRTVATLDAPASDNIEALRERVRELEAQQPAAEPHDAAGYSDSDRVTVLHGWPNVKGRNGVTGPSGALTWFVDGVARNVAYKDAKHWRDTWGKNSQSGRWNIVILPQDAELPEFAKATGIQPMDLPKLCAMIDAVDTDELIRAWTPERALRFAERITASLARGGVR